MSKIVESSLELIGNTPMLKASCYAAKVHATHANLFAKLEYLNPAGSIKDRVALAMVEDAEKTGILKPGATIIEPTSGNTGIGLAIVAAAKGYEAILTLPDTMSMERRNLLKCSRGPMDNSKVSLRLKKKNLFQNFTLGHLSNILTFKTPIQIAS